MTPSGEKTVPVSCNRDCGAGCALLAHVKNGRIEKITDNPLIDDPDADPRIFAYGFHDMAPRYQIKDGGTYGIPYRALCVKGIDNLYAAGMMITADHRAHMSTRNTVSCMGQGQATGTAAALCAAKELGSRELPKTTLRDALVQGGVYFEA